MKHLATFLFLSLTISLTLAQQAKISGELKAYQKLTFSWEGPHATEEEKTFLDYRLQVVFTGPDGQKMHIPGYFAGDGIADESGASAGNIWRAHLLPLVPGEWTFEARFIQGDQVAISQDPDWSQGSAFHGDTGSFTILPADSSAPGFLSKGKLQYVGEHFLQFTDESYFLKMGANSPEVFLEYGEFDGTSSERSYATHVKDWKIGDPLWHENKGKGIIGVINYLKSQGINAHYFMLMNAYGDGKQAFPWTGPDAYYQYDLSKLDQWQLLFDHMMEEGVMPQFVLSEQENQSYFEHKEGGVFAAARKVFYREMAARFGYLNAVTWNIGEESGWDNEPTYGKGITTTQRRQFAAYLKQLLPYSELIVVHNGPSNTDAIFEGLVGDSFYSGISYQGNFEDPYYGYERILHWKEQSASTGFPWVVSYDEPYTNPEFPDLETWSKNSLWAALMAGGAGVEFYIGKGRDLNIEDYRQYEAYWQAMAQAKSFFLENDIPFQQLKPLNTQHPMTWGLSDDGKKHRILFLREGGEIALTLPAGQYWLKWFDPELGESYTTGQPFTVEQAGLVHLGHPPTYKEKAWVLWVQKK
ncbi:DUF5060 domain-containing protein [Cyclobacterium sp.]|uniref:DUF5060 domain-containing protein n=1 Tax=Cyclobacterium sp. TaxID=1966343 RepID=UPI0019A57503|nr:DUF5060 domain-containing protein [Cyclobacterium sp.]MBD3631327.1 DUF5060 domain-containing protein [Cyclobacterium sp.]